MAALQRAPIATIVAVGGYGKTTLAIEYAASRGIAWALVRLEPGDDIPEVQARAGGRHCCAPSCCPPLRRTGAGGRAGGQSFALAGRAWMPELPLRREPEVATMFLSLIGTASDDASMLERGGVSITVLGRFEVRQSGALLSIPPGRPEALVKLLSVNGGRLPSTR